MIKENLQYVKNKILESCNKSERNFSDVTLIDVSKTKPVEMLMEAYELGERHFGENKVQELVDKYEQLPKDIHWHMIGHLQTNKVKYIIDKVDYIHSVDSIKLAQTINKEAAKKDLISNILIEVNVAKEESKFGIFEEDVMDFIQNVSSMKNLCVKGLMTIAPFVDDPEENRDIFRKLKQLSVDINAKNIDNVNVSILSMGMTNDYTVAIEEGASFVRVGTGIFGKRDYSHI